MLSTEELKYRGVDDFFIELAGTYITLIVFKVTMEGIKSFIHFRIFLKI